MSASYRPTRAVIDLDAIRHNVGELGRGLNDGVERLAVVKANAYGHGDVPVARAALDAGATWLGVALVEEGVRLRAAGIEAPILILVDTPPAAAEAVVEHGLVPSVYSRRSAEALDLAAQGAGATIDVHVCVDTGMHREGVGPDEIVERCRDLSRMPGLRPAGLWSHFAVADDQDDPFTRRQLEVFERCCEAVEASGLEVGIRHLSNSAGMFAAGAAFDLVRMGIAMYGLYPARWMRDHVDLRPAMRLVSEVTVVRRVPAGEGVSYGLTFRPQADSTIANVPIGYGDGYARALGGRADVLIGGRRRRIAGRVTMDTIMVDCGSDEVEAGEEVVLIGAQGDDEITADELAGLLGTISYEVVCAVGPRVPRVYGP